MRASILSRRLGPKGWACIAAALLAATVAVLAPAPRAVLATTTVNLGVSSFGRILVDPASAQIFVSSPGANAIFVLDLNGNIKTAITGEAGAGSMAVVGSTLYVALTTGGSIRKIDTGTLTDTGLLVSGLVNPTDLVYAGSKLWTTTGNCAAWSVQLVSVDPSAATPSLTAYPTAFNANNGLSYCAEFATDHAFNPNLLLAWDWGLEPATLTTFDVSSGSPVETLHVWESQLQNLQDVAINPDGAHLIAASGYPYEFDEYNLSNLQQDGVVYPANTYPTAVDTSAANGGIMVGGLNGIYDPDFYSYQIGNPAVQLAKVDFGGTSNTVPARGVAISPDGATGYAISGGSGSGILLNLVPLPPTDADLALSGVPADIAVNATGPSGAVVNYAAPSAVDEDATVPPVTCSPASGSTFAIGTTTVTCSTFDGDDTPSTVTASFHVTVNDTDLALSAVPADITAAATGASGATVSFTAPTAVDEDASSPAVTCSPASGSTFAVGTTTVTCSATDPDDSPSTVSASFHVTVTDTDLALAGVPADITAVATGASGATVSFTAPTAADEDGGSPAVTCSPASGSTFALGTTTVTCGATDSDDSPSTVTASFHVTVIPDIRLGISVNPTSVKAGGNVTTTATVTNIGKATDKITITYVVTFKDSSGNTLTVALHSADVTLSPGQTTTRSFNFPVKSSTALGPYSVSVTARDVTGSVVQTGGFTVVS